MDNRKPSVLITTYSNSSGGQSQDCAGATNSELVTDLFNKRNRRSQPTFRLRLDLNQIKGPTGTIRGHKDVVKKSLENIQVVSRWSKLMPANFDLSPPSLTSFLGQFGQQNSLSIQSSSLQSIILDETYRNDFINRLVEDEAGQCVAYTTTLGIIRRTFEDSRQMRSILSLNLIEYEERDIYLNQEFREQLKLRCKSIIVPALFIDGQFLGVSIVLLSGLASDSSSWRYQSSSLGYQRVGENQREWTTTDQILQVQGKLRR